MSNVKNKLIFKEKEYELIEVPYDRFRVYGKGYEDIGFNALHKIEEDIPLKECFTLRIKDKYYGLKLIEKL
jgi:hypothetical protein